MSWSRRLAARAIDDTLPWAAITGIAWALGLRWRGVPELEQRLAELQRRRNSFTREDYDCMSAAERNEPCRLARELAKSQRLVTRSGRALPDRAYVEVAYGFRSPRPHTGAIAPRDRRDYGPAGPSGETRAPSLTITCFATV